MRKITYLSALNEALCEEMERDKDIFLIGEDIGKYGGVFGVTRGIYEKYGFERVKQTPISESVIIGAAIGAAITGLRPIAEIMYVDFITLAMDQIVNQAANLHFMSGGQIDIPMVIRAQYGTGTAEAAQHSQCLEAWFAHVPGLKVVMPSTAYDAKGLLKSSIRDNNPVIFLEHRGLYSKSFEIPEKDWEIKLGKGDIKREGSDITLIATGSMVEKALEVAEDMSSDVDIEIIDPRTIYPLDINLISKSVEKTGNVLIVQEAVTKFGTGSEILRNIIDSSFDFLNSPPKVLGSMYAPIAYSFSLEKAAVPQKNDIANAVMDMVRK